MKQFLGKWSEPFYAVLRIVAGVLFAFHGAQKLFGSFGGQQVADYASKMGVAGIVEFVGGILIAIGLFASWAAFLASGQMAVAYWTVHASQGTWPIENGGELAVLYCFVFLYVAARGAGIWSVASAARKPNLG